MGTLRLIPTTESDRHEGGVYCCAYAPDAAFVLSGGWDGQLRLWDTQNGAACLALAASHKPLSCCSYSPDGTQWLAGTMEGMLSIIDGVSQQTLQSFMAHTRPISSIDFSPDGQQLVTASWDRLVVLRKVGKEREGRNFSGHTDIVAGCRFTLDGKQVVSWSYDGTIKLWDPALTHELASLSGHTDRVVALTLSPDGRYAVSGGRDSTVRLWDLDDQTEVSAVNIGAEVRGCFYLLDAESVVVADALGRLFLMSMPSFDIQTQVQAPFRMLSGAVSPSGLQLAVGAEDGQVYFLELEGFEEAPLVVTPTASLKPKASLLGRMFGGGGVTKTYSYTCPACRQPVQVASLQARTNCPRCRRALKVNLRMPVLQGS